MAKSMFPKDFYWGVGTSAHQVEGGNHNQWSVWELAQAADLARSAHQRLVWMPNFQAIGAQAKKPENYVSGKAVAHYQHFRKDFDLVKAMQMNAFRFSIEWSRIEPQEGQWDEEAIEHYRTYIQELQKRGIEPFLTLWHWTNPVWFEEKGAFVKRSNLMYFRRFVAKVMDELGSDLNYVLILNEPNNYAWFSYMESRWPPAVHSPLEFLLVYGNLLSAHRQAYKIIKQINPALQVSSAPQLVSNEPKDPANRWHRLNAWFADYANNWVWLGFCKRRQDFIGCNNYFKNYISGFGVLGIDNPKEPASDMGWYMEPRAIGEILTKIHKRYPDVPIIVTENGLADSEDKHRKWWLQETLLGLHQAMAKGANVKGYFYWSLLDNFEWADGWWPKFGLIAVDRQQNMKRIARPSAKWLAKFLRQLKTQ